MFRLLSYFVVFLTIIFNLSLVFAVESTQAMQATSACCFTFEEAKVKYFKSNQYNEFVDYLSKIKEKDKSGELCIYYYQALARFNQLKYLEEKQSWDEYFASGNTYREELVEKLKQVLTQTQSNDCLRVKSRLLVWQFHQGQQDAFNEQSLIDLMTDLKLYAQAKNDTVLLKEAADTLLAYQQNSQAREVYKLYCAALVSGEIDDAALKGIAAGFYKEGNLALAQTVYDLYLERISKKLAPEKLAGELFEIASLFVYKVSGLADPAYAEKIYAKISELGLKDAFNEESIYLRAFNLEKIKEYSLARDFYWQLTQLYPDSRHFDEAIYKVGMLDVYALANLTSGRSCFEKLIAKPILSSQGISAFYQLGLLSQWQGDLVKAKDYYDAVLKNAQGKYPSIVACAQERLNELKDNKTLNYNLQSFLDLSLKQEKISTGVNSAQLQASGYILEKNQSTNISTLLQMAESGCNRVELQYLWSGNLGGATPTTAESNFKSAYVDSGTKEINLVILAPGGNLEHAFVMVDVY